MNKLLASILILILFASFTAHAQTDNGLLPNGYIVGNGSGSRGAARQIPLGSDLSLSGNTMNVVTGTSGSAIPRLSGNNVWGTSQTFSSAPTLSSVLSCSSGLITNSSGAVGCGSTSSVVYDIRAYGALCDGVADDAAAIQAAINAAQITGGTVWSPGGTCLVGNTINILDQGFGLSKISIKGQGNYVTFWKAKSGFNAGSGAAILYFTGLSTVSDLNLDGNNQNVNGIYNDNNVAQFGGLIIERMGFALFTQSAKSAIVNHGSLAITHVSKSYFNTNTYGYYSDNWNVGAVITENHFLGGRPIYITTLGATEGILINKNEIIAGNGLRPIEIYNTCVECQITNNILDAVPVGVSGCLGSLISAVSIDGTRSTKIMNNWIAKGLRGPNSSLGNTDLTITNNTFPDGCFMWLYDINTAIISNNLFNGASSGSQLILQNGGRWSIVGNVFRDNGTISLLGSMFNCTIVGNVIGASATYGSCSNVGNVGP